jgi:hypothetical protein
VEKGSWNRSYWKRKDFFYCYVITARSQLTPFDRSSTVLIQDGMALLQSMNVKAFKTFGDLAEHFIKGPIGKDFFYCYVITARSKYQRTAKY